MIRKACGLDNNRRTPAGVMTILALFLINVLVGTASAAEPAPQPPKQASRPAQPPSLSRIGLDLEAARSAPTDTRQDALQSVAAVMARWMDKEMEREQRTIAHYLFGTIQQEMGQSKPAIETFERAVKYGKDQLLVAHAEFARIQTLEADGRDEEAAAAWREWLERHPKNALMPQAGLRLVWNDLRRGELGDAGRILSELGTDEPWLLDDPWFNLAEATRAFLSDDPDAAIVLLDKPDIGPPGIYLRALCHARKNETLKAAADFQTLAARYPESPLRDQALLAKANTFLASGVHRSAAEEFERVCHGASDKAVRAEAALRHAAAIFLDGDTEQAAGLLQRVVAEHAGTGVAARAQFLLGETMLGQQRYQEAIVEFNRVLTSYFDQAVAASAQYRVGRCLDALDRRDDATSAYQAVVSGYPLEPEAPAAAYLAGVGLIEQGKPMAAAPYFQLVLDRYAANESPDGLVVFAAPEHQELVEASLCLLMLSYHRAGDLGHLTGAPHLLLQKTPPSRSPWRAYALLIDADALAAQGLFAQSQTELEKLIAEFPDHPAAPAANQLLAWNYAQQGQEELAIRTEQRMLERYAAGDNQQLLSLAYLNTAHARFNQQRYEEAAGAYEDFLRRFADHPQRPLALYQAGLCYLRLDRAGDAVDKWETIVRADPTAEIAERAFARAGDLYFQAEHYEEAMRCYAGLLENFARSPAAASAMLRIAQCHFNSGDDMKAFERFSAVTEHFPGTAVAREAEQGIEMALYRLGQTASGVDELRELVQLYPNSTFAADAQYQIATKLYEKSQFLEAAEEFRRVVSQFPAFASADNAQFLMGDAYAQAGADDQARQSYEHFVHFFPESELATTVQFRLGMMYFESGQYMRAAINFTGIQQQEAPAELAAASLYNLALCKRLLGQVEEARSDLESYRQTYGSDERAAQIATQLADIHAQTGKDTEAIAEYQRALAADPPRELLAELHYRLGECRERAGDPDKALQAYLKAGESAVRTDPFRLSAVARCAALYEEKEDYPRALAAYRDLIRNASDSELVAAATARATELEAAIQ
jgi:TolA-binding protein